jgi:hypothetical protein
VLRFLGDFRQTAHNALFIVAEKAYTLDSRVVIVAPRQSIYLQAVTQAPLG